MEGGVRAAVDDTTSVKIRSIHSIRHEFQIVRKPRVCTVKTSPRPPPNHPKTKTSPEEALGGPRGAWGGSGGALGELWEALGEPVGGSGGALGELWEALYIEKLPINRTSGRYVLREFV